jgi:hypothetical protein
MIVFDAGALVALDKGDPAMLVRFQEAAEEDIRVVVPLGALAQAWRGGPKGARLARALGGMEPASFDVLARQVGELCTKAGTADVVDASVALVAARPGVRTLYTSDAGDLQRLLVAAGGDRPRVVGC